MAVKTFAAIDIGSYELSMKIFEVSKKNGMKQIDHIRHSIDMGTETYTTGKLSFERVDELCMILHEFSDIMKTYQVTDYKAYGTSAIRESKNRAILTDQVRLRTGIEMDILSNSEQRFLDYKSIALQGQQFDEIIEKGTAIVDIGGGSIQISLFDKDTLVSTQNLKLGVLRLRESMNFLNASLSQYQNLIGEIVESQLSVYKKLYLKDRVIENLIIVDDYISRLIRHYYRKEGKGDITTREQIEEFMEKSRRSALSTVDWSVESSSENVRIWTAYPADRMFWIFILIMNVWILRLRREAGNS